MPPAQAGRNAPLELPKALIGIKLLSKLVVIMCCINIQKYHSLCG